MTQWIDLDSWDEGQRSLLHFFILAATPYDYVTIFMICCGAAHTGLDHVTEVVGHGGIGDANVPVLAVLEILVAQVRPVGATKFHVDYLHPQGAASTCAADSFAGFHLWQWRVCIGVVAIYITILAEPDTEYNTQRHAVRE
jgi:hypothetical protein